MKYFNKTIYTNLPLQGTMYILKEGEETKLVQFDTSGKYISTVKSFDIPDGNYALDKKKFNSVIKELKKDFEVRVTKKKMIFTKETTKIEVPLLEFDLDQNMPKDYELKDVPENFWRLFEKAAKIAGDHSKEKKQAMLDNVHIKEGFIYSGSQGGAFKGILSTKTDIDLVLSADILNVVINPLKYAIDGDNLVLTSDYGIAILRTIDGTYPDIEKLFIDEPEVGNILGTNAMKDLSEALNSAKAMELNAVEITSECSLVGTMINLADTDGMTGFKKDVNITLPIPAKFSINNLMTGLVGDRIYCKGGFEKMYVFGNEKQTIIMPLR